MKRATSSAAGAEPVSPELRAQLEAVAAMPDSDINLSDPDAPEAMDWSGAVRGKYHKPRKVLRSVRYDADVLAFFEATGPGYQTRMNRVLRASMLRSLRRCRKAAGQGEQAPERERSA